MPGPFICYNSGCAAWEEGVKGYGGAACCDELVVLEMLANEAMAALVGPWLFPVNGSLCEAAKVDFGGSHVIL